jgi:hypothetical protein
MIISPLLEGCDVLEVPHVFCSMSTFQHMVSVFVSRLAKGAYWVYFVGPSISIGDAGIQDNSMA